MFVDPSTWDLSVSYDLSINRRFFGQGMRYVSTSEDGAIQHIAVTTGDAYGDPVELLGDGTRDVLEGSENPHETTGDEAAVSGQPMHEGAITMTKVLAYERNAKARTMCIEHYGYDCAACGMNFEHVYGELGRDFIHVHHLRELSSIRAEYEVDPIKDLRPICPNCHAMVHRRRDPALSIDELRGILASRTAGSPA